MGSALRPKPVSIYAALLHAYPRSFRRHYGDTMVQTFDDMLEHERGGVGHIRVWARTLVNLPFSASKEHVTNGKDIIMNRTAKIIIAVAVIAVVVASAGSFWYGTLHSRQTLGVERVSVVQLADAMQQDDFYSSYGDAAVLFSGKVSHVETKNGVQLVTFVTSRPYAVVCQLQGSRHIIANETLSVAAPAGSADRLPRGVRLHNCVLN